MNNHFTEVFGVYQLVNQVTQERYVGSTTRSFWIRWTSWRCDLRRGKGNQTLQQAWQEYGERNFAFSILEIVECKEQVLAREQAWLELLKPEYNKAPRAGSTLGVKPSEATKQKISNAQKGRKIGPHDALHRAKISDAMLGNTNSTGRVLSPEHKSRIAVSKTGIPLSAAHKQKLRNAYLSRRQNGDL
jgi:group I intron endonuclease